MSVTTTSIRNESHKLRGQIGKLPEAGPLVSEVLETDSWIFSFSRKIAPIQWDHCNWIFIYFKLIVVLLATCCLETISFSFYTKSTLLMIINTINHSFIQQSFWALTLSLGSTDLPHYCPNYLLIIFQDGAKCRKLMDLLTYLKFFKNHYPHPRCNIWSGIREREIYRASSYFFSES